MEAERGVGCVKGSPDAVAGLRARARDEEAHLGPDECQVLPELEEDDGPGGIIPHAGAEHPGQDTRKAGSRAIEEATANGASVNVTVCFMVPQAIAVAEGGCVGAAWPRRWKAGHGA